MQICNEIELQQNSVSTSMIGGELEVRFCRVNFCKTFLQMISAEVPALIARACEMFLEELTLRAWVHADDNKRKTLQVLQQIIIFNF